LEREGAAAVCAVMDGHGGSEVACFLRTELQLRIADMKDPFDTDEWKKLLSQLDRDVLAELECRNMGYRIPPLFLCRDFQLGFAGLPLSL